MHDILTSLFEFKHILSGHPMFAAGILLMMGHFLGKLASRAGLPEITGYIVAGLLMGEAVTGIFPSHMGESFKIVTEVALSLIALTIGGEFSRVKLVRMGKAAVIITAAQLLLTFGAVAAGLCLFGMELPFALLLAAIASATAPAATVAIVQSLRAHGRFVDYLYGTVALDDAGCVVIFGVTFAIVSGLLGASARAVSGVALVGEALLEVFISIAIGVVSGLCLHLLVRRKSNANEILVVSLGVIFLTTALAIVFHLSPLLTNMAAGCTLINVSARNHRVFRILEPLSPPVYALFFVIAGTELNPRIVMQEEILRLGLVYLAFRAAGKYGGVYLGCVLSKVSARVRNYLGLCMLPQAGVAIGLVLLIQASPITAALAPEHLKSLDAMVNIVLLSVFVNELLGPPISRFAVIKGNDMEE